MLLLLLPVAFAITTRHDVADDDYIVLAESFEAVGFTEGCSGTLVAPDVVLTAAHCLDDNADGEVDPGRTPRSFFLGPSWDEATAEYAVDGWALHPERGRDSRERWDVALLYLAEPVVDVQPIAVSDANPVGQEIVFVGYGGTGTGLDADYWSEAAYDGLKRAAQNTVDGRDEDLIGTGALVVDFDAPDGTTNTASDVYELDSSASALPLEGVTGPGDSGGPMLMEIDGEWRVVGVASAGWNPLSETDDDERAGQYGSVAEHAALFPAETVAFLAEVMPSDDADPDGDADSGGDEGDEEDGEDDVDGGGEDADAGDAGDKSSGCSATAAPASALGLFLPLIVLSGRRRQEP